MTPDGCSVDRLGATDLKRRPLSSLAGRGFRDHMVNFNSVDYANWDAFAAANPTFRIAPGQIPFIIADEPGSYALNSIDLR